ncbi:MAG: aquaporin [Anaerolineales bacterium]|nr:aquaporin [Anaerolineales bacterium]
MKTRIWLAEFIGTAALIFVGAGAGALGMGGVVGVALAHGLILIGLAYAYGSISGTYINPAVTLAVTLAGKLTWPQALRYWAAQMLGGAFGAALLYIILGGAGTGLGATLPSAGINSVQAVIVEAALTFLLATVVLRTAVLKDSTPFAGVAIGVTLAALILMGGPLTGASLNPARTFGPALFTGTLGSLWIYIAGPFLGATAAAWSQRFLQDAQAPGAKPRRKAAGKAARR